MRSKIKKTLIGILFTLIFIPRVNADIEIISGGNAEGRNGKCSPDSPYQACYITGYRFRATMVDKFGKKVFPQKLDLNDYVYAGIITPSIHYCMGGVTMNSNAQLIKTDGKVMNGLFGAGEVTGGVHGGNRLGGNSLMECGVFGRRAARSAVEYINTFDS